MLGRADVQSVSAIHWKWILHTYLDVQNVYNRQNPEFVRYSFNYSKQGCFTGFPIIPSLVFDA